MTELEAGGMRPQAKGHQSHQKPGGTKKDTSILGLFFFLIVFSPPVCAMLYATLYQLTNLLNTPPAGLLFLMAETLWLSLSWEETSFCWGREGSWLPGCEGCVGLSATSKESNVFKITLIYLRRERITELVM